MFGEYPKDLQQPPEPLGLTQLFEHMKSQFLTSTDPPVVMLKAPRWSCHALSAQPARLSPQEGCAHWCVSVLATKQGPRSGC